MDLDSPLFTAEERALLLADELKMDELKSEAVDFIPYRAAPTILEQAKKHRGRPLGFPSLDILLDGICSGELIIVTAVPGVGKCFGVGTKVLMANGTIKKVEDIVVGDFVMGWDSKPKKVLSLGRGQEQMYKVYPTKGRPFVCNKSHILTLQKTGEEKIIDISLKDYLKVSDGLKIRYKLFHASVNFPKQKEPPFPYLLGVWLGDGNSRDPRISLGDKKRAIIKYLYKICQQSGWRISRSKRHNNCWAFGLIGFKKFLKENNLIQNKHIPHQYKVGSRKTRLLVMAGLLDTDGYLSGANTYEWVSVSKQLAKDMAFIARSLGFLVTERIKRVKGKPYHRLLISGDTAQIPLRVGYKRAKPRRQIKNHLVTGIKKIRPLGIGDYYGFTIEGDGRFLLEDFLVVHNSTWCQSVTRNLALAGHAVLWYTLEVTLENFLRPLVQHDAGAVYEAEKLLKVSDLPIYFPKQMEKVDFATLKKVIRYANVKYGVEHVFIDHLHYLLDSKSLMSQKSTSLFIGDRLRQLRQIAIETGVSIFLVAHTTKIPDGERPTMFSMRDSSFVAAEADVVIVLWRERLKIPIRKNVGGMEMLETFSPVVHCAVEKARRTGQKGIIKLRWERGLYFEMTEEEAKVLEIAAEIKT